MSNSPPPVWASQESRRRTLWQFWLINMLVDAVALTIGISDLVKVLGSNPSETAGLGVAFLMVGLKLLPMLILLRGGTRYIQHFNVSWRPRVKRYLVIRAYGIAGLFSVCCLFISGMEVAGVMMVTLFAGSIADLAGKG